MTECAFCDIVAGGQDAHVFYEDDETVAFLDANPAVHGHSLVIPRTHREDLFDDDGQGAAAVFETVERVASALRSTLALDGVSLFYTTADLVGDVTHAHVHVVPRYEGDDVHLALERNALAEPAADRLDARLRAALE